MALQTFSPREIQSRVRGGESAEVIAAETGWPLDKVMRYAEPLLAERAYIAEQAQAVEVRRSGGGATLLESAYATVGADPQAGTLAWDAFRREDGKWIVSASFADRDGTHTARWTYDHAGRNIHPLDDDARALMGARPVPVADPDIDIAEALDLVADIPVVREEAVETRPRLVAVPDAADDTDDADEAMADDALADEDGVRGAGAADSSPTVTIPHPSTPEPQEPVLPDMPAPASARTPAEKKPAAKPRGRKGRASVPSWDEILFGSTKADD